MKAYRDDKEILKMALADGCSESITSALEKMDGTQSTVIVGNRIYLVHAVPDDSGYSCFEAPSQLAMPMMLLMLAPIIGKVDTAMVRPCENAPSQRGREH